MRTKIRRLSPTGADLNDVTVARVEPMPNWAYRAKLLRKMGLTDQQIAEGKIRFIGNQDPRIGGIRKRVA